MKMTLYNGISRVSAIFSSRALEKKFPHYDDQYTKLEVKHHMKKVLRKILAIAECVLNAVLAAALMLTL